MKESVKRKRDSIINVVYIAMVIGLVYVLVKYLFGFVAPFLAAFLFAVVLQKPLRWLDKKTKNKCHALWSILLVLVTLIIVIGPVVTLLVFVGKEVAGFFSYLFGELSDLPSFLATLQKEVLSFLKFLPDNLYASVSGSITETFAKLINNFDLSSLNIDFKSVTSALGTGISGAFSVVKNIPMVLVGIIICIIAWIFFTKDYDFIVNFIRLQLPEGKKNILSEIKQIFSKTVFKMLKAYGLIMFITFCELLLGFTILNLTGIMNNSYIIIIAALIAIFDILPVAGSGGVLIPWALISFVMGSNAQAIGLLVIYCVISVIRQYIEPRIVGGSLDVHPLVTLAGLYLGAKLFGVLGIFIVPLGVMTIKAFNDAGRIHLYNPPERN